MLRYWQQAMRMLSVFGHVWRPVVCMPCNNRFSGTYVIIKVECSLQPRSSLHVFLFCRRLIWYILHILQAISSFVVCVCMYVFLHVHLYVCIYACIYLRECVCIDVWVHAHIHEYTNFMYKGIPDLCVQFMCDWPLFCFSLRTTEWKYSTFESMCMCMLMCMLMQHMCMLVTCVDIYLPAYIYVYT